MIQRKSSQLRRGDTVVAHGMQVLLDCDPTVYPDGRYGPVFAFRGRVLNMEELRQSDPWLASFVVGGAMRGETEPRWTIQGNDLASWTVAPDSPLVRYRMAHPDRVVWSPQTGWTDGV